MYCIYMVYCTLGCFIRVLDIRVESSSKIVESVRPTYVTGIIDLSSYCSLRFLLQLYYTQSSLHTTGLLHLRSQSEIEKMPNDTFEFHSYPMSKSCLLSRHHFGQELIKSQRMMTYLQTKSHRVSTSAG